MTANMPPLGTGQHHASVNYVATFAAITLAGGRVSFSNPGGTAFVFTFETGRSQPDPQTDLWEVAWDYSWFDQSAEEAAIARYLSGICALMAALLGVPVPDVEQSVTVRRQWSVAANVQGSAAATQYEPSTVTEIMPFPAQAAGADAAQAAEGAGVSQQ